MNNDLRKALDLLRKARPRVEGMHLAQGCRADQGHIGLLREIDAFLASQQAEGAQGERVVQTAPERIYLIVGADCPRDADFSELAEVAWCEDDLDDGIEYVRADKARAALAQPSPAPELVAYADIGRAVEESISVNLPEWSPSDCPSEVVVHLINERDAAQARVAELELKLDTSDYAYDSDRSYMLGVLRSLLPWMERANEKSDEDIPELLELRAVLAGKTAVAQAVQQPLKLSDDVREFLQEGINSVMGGEDADVDYEFANQLGKLLGPIYAAPVVPVAQAGQVLAGWRIEQAGDRIVVQQLPSGAGYAAAREGASGIAESVLFLLAADLLPAAPQPGAQFTEQHQTLTQGEQTAGSVNHLPAKGGE